MKHRFTLLATLSMLTLSAFSQITINLDDLEYQAGDYNKMYGRSSLYIVQGLTGKIGGPHTWDFSTGPTNINYTFDYVLPATTPCSSNYPLATVAEKRTGDGSEAYLFLDHQTGTGRVNYGACQPGVISVPYVFNPPIVDFPETINYIDSWSGSTNFPAQSGGIDVDVDYTFISFCNAYGTLALPGGLGSFPCLQVNNLEHYKFYWEGFLVGESYIRSFYWLIENAGIAVIIVSEEGTSAPPENFAYSSGYNRMYESSKLMNSNEFSLNMTVFLEGPFDQLTGTMNTSLNPNLIPLAQPFNIPPWNYTGTESVTSIPSIDIVDWILLDLRDATQASLATSNTRIARQAAFIKRDGSIVGLDGSSLPSFDALVVNDLFVAVWHRNHLGIISANPLTNLGGNYTYDFATGSNQTYGGSGAQNEINPGVWGMISGDANADGGIFYSDKSNFWNLTSGMTGYLSTDLSLDGQVNNQDKNECWYPNLSKGSMVP